MDQAFASLACLVVMTTMLGVTSSQMSIPRSEVGFVYNNGRPDAKVKVVSFLDLSCPDSQQAFPTLLKVADHFDKDVQLKVVLFPLPYHRNSHVMSKGAHVINSQPNSTSVYNWFKIIYANLNMVVPSATADKTDGEVLDILTPLAKQATGISPDVFKKGVSNEDIDEATRLAWKYACTRGVYGTPMFTVNDVFVQAQADWTLEQWIDLIKPLLSWAY